MKTSRRNFLQMFGASIASLFAPKLEGDEVVVQSTEQGVVSGLTVIGETGTVEVPESGDFFDYLDRVVDKVAWTEESTLGWNLECDPDQLDKLNALFDSCECEPLKIEVHFDQCQKIEPGAEVYITRDWGETWELAGEIA